MNKVYTVWAISEYDGAQSETLVNIYDSREGARKAAGMLIEDSNSAAEEGDREVLPWKKYEAFDDDGHNYEFWSQERGEADKWGYELEKFAITEYEVLTTPKENAS